MRPTSAICLLLLIEIGGAARGAPLPANAIEENTVLLARLDLSRVDFPSVRALARDIASSVSPQAASAADGALATVQMGYESVLGSGLAAVNLVVTTRKDDQPPDWAAYLQMRAGADEAAVRKMLTQHGKLDEAPKFARADGYLVAYGHDQELPRSGSAARARRFAEAMADSGSQATLTLAFVPNDPIRALANTFPTAGLSKQAADIVPFLLKSRWTVVVASLGKTPGVGVTIRAEDEAAAEYLCHKLSEFSNNSDAPETKSDEATASGKSARTDRGNGAKATATAGIIHPIRQGTKTSFTIQGPALHQLVAMLLPAALHAGAKASADEATVHLNALGAAFTAYVTAHHGTLPDNLQQLRPFIGPDPSFDDLLKNPRTGASPGFIYIRPAARMSMLKNPGSTPILFESRNGLRDPAGAIGYADGQVKAR